MIKSLKNMIHEDGFFKNIGDICPTLTDFLSKCVTIKKGGKEYIIHHGLFFDLDDLRNTIYTLTTFKGRRYEITGKASIKITINEICWEAPLEHPYIKIKYTSKSLNTGTETHEQYTVDNIWGSRIDKKDKDGATYEYDKKLKEFIER